MISNTPAYGLPVGTKLALPNYIGCSVIEQRWSLSHDVFNNNPAHTILVNREQQHSIHRYQ